MKKIIITVPKGIDYVSDWEQFKLFEFPHILNKKLTGCGFTQYALTCNYNVILCSPRRILLENKVDWYKELKKKGGELSYDLLYARNDYETALGVDKDLTVAKPVPLSKINVSDADRKNFLKQFKQKVCDFANDCSSRGKFCKILVTYDSYKKVKDALTSIGLFDKFYTIVDEMQSIFTDATFKSDTELEFVDNLQKNSKICYVSATPMLEKYLDQLDEFKNLPYYELDWKTEDPSRIIKPVINTFHCNRLTQKAKDIIEKYRNDSWSYSEGTRSVLDDNGNIVEVKSKEAVFYMNSVKNICDIIRSSNMKRSECNVLCADTENNRKAIMKAFHETAKTFQGIGKVPMESEMSNNKMFTFCTRTVYLGADFWSTNARSFVFSDANIKSLTVDVYLDIPQILGRQRSAENPWKNEVSFYYKTTRADLALTENAFKDRVSQKMNKTNDYLKIYNEILANKKGSSDYANLTSAQIDLYLGNIRLNNYSNDYLAVNKHSGKSPMPVLNKLVLVSEQRAFDIMQTDYADEFTLRSTIKQRFNLDLKDSDKEAIIDTAERFETMSVFTEKMKYLCDVMDDGSLSQNIKEGVLDNINTAYSDYYRELGSAGIKTCSYRRSLIVTEYQNRIRTKNNNSLVAAILSKFKVGERYIKKDIKSELGNIYKKFGISKTAKATDINEYFETKQVILLVKNNQGVTERLHGLELLKKK